MMNKNIRKGNREAKAMMAAVREELGIDPIRPREQVKGLFGTGSYNDREETDGDYFWDDASRPSRASASRRAPAR